MRRTGRWLSVAAGTALVVLAPFGLHRLPAVANDIGAAQLLAAVRGSQDASWSGQVEAEGTLALPDADRFNDVASLLGERTRMRAWWQDEEHWRVDQLLVAGEVDLIHDGEQTTSWDYERERATVSIDPDIRLPRSADLVPPVLGLRLVKGLDAADVSRLPTRRIAGLSAPGLRLDPGSDLSSIGHTDLWADPRTGVPLLVEVYADGADRPALTTRFTDFSDDRPTDSTVDFEAAPRAEVRFDDVLDIADAANQYAPVRPPRTIAGLAKSTTSDRAVGVYGEGMTQVIAIPLRDREADALRDQLAVTRGVVQDRTRSVVSVGPLGVLLTGGPGDGGWLLAGTLSQVALERAGRDVTSGFDYVDR